MGLFSAGWLLLSVVLRLATLSNELIYGTTACRVQICLVSWLFAGLFLSAVYQHNIVLGWNAIDVPWQTATIVTSTSARHFRGWPGCKSMCFQLLQMFFSFTRPALASARGCFR
jgi:hypothetical protein